MADSHLIPDPETVNFLSEPEREAMLADLPQQAPTMKAKTFNFDQVKSLFKDPTFVPFLMIWITHGIGGWGISFVLPTVIYELGISNTAISQVMTMVRILANLPKTGWMPVSIVPLSSRGSLTPFMELSSYSLLSRSSSSSFCHWPFSSTMASSIHGWLGLGSRLSRSFAIYSSSQSSTRLPSTSL